MSIGTTFYNNEDSVLSLTYSIYNETLSEGDQFTVPAGVFEATVRAWTSTSGGWKEQTFVIEVEGNEIYQYNGNEDSDFPTLVYVSGGGDELDGVVWYDGTESAPTDGNTYKAGTNLVTGDLYDAFPTEIMILWTNTCPDDNTNLHSDFNPILNLQSSGLKKVGSSYSLDLDITLPTYYYDVNFYFGTDQCPDQDEPTVSARAVGCNAIYETAVDYFNNCNFELIEDADDSTNYHFRGELTVSAKYALNVNGFDVTRTVSQPVNWRVSLDKEITVESNVTIVNDHVCYVADNDADLGNPQCNNHGCCRTNGTCDCACADSEHTGYAGIYCEEDVTPPTCTIDDEQFKIITLNSTHGGCMRLGAGFYVDEDSIPVFGDNSDYFWVKRSTDSGAYTYNGDNTSQNNSDIHSTCFDIGMHTFDWEVRDVFAEVNATANEKTACSLTIIVNDVSTPFVDCYNCNSGNATHVNLCIDLVKTEVAVADLKDYFNDEYTATKTVDFAGNYASNGLWNDCECIVKSDSPFYLTQDSEHVTNSWADWELFTAYDTHDGHLTVVLPSVETADNIYELSYNATDDEGNEGSCPLRVLYDATKPTCQEFINLNVSRDPDNKNYTRPIVWDAIADYNASISGLASGPTFGNTSWDPTGQIFHIGYNTEKVYSSEWTLTDNAGNTNTCKWEITILNPVPCEWPWCDDLPPNIVNGTCPADIVIQCHENENCGCGEWTEPTFSDDKYVASVEVYIDDVLFETHNRESLTIVPGVGSLLNSSTEHEPLAVGTSTIKYIAYDYHDETAECQFTVTIEDTVAPVYSNCPEDAVINTTTANADFTYNVTALDECSLNSVTTINGHLVGDPKYNYTGTTGNTTDTLDVGSYSYWYRTYDDHNNIETCTWDVTIRDTGIPNITCPENITLRNIQGTVNTTIPFVAEASDNWDGNITHLVTYTGGQPGDEYAVGNYTITALIFDSSLNRNSCFFTIEVLEAYPFGAMTPALYDAKIKEYADNNGPYFGAHLKFVTLSNEYHKIVSWTADPPTADNNNALIDLATGINEISGDGTCTDQRAVCWQYFDFYTQFEDCNIDLQEYDVTTIQDCLPSDCNETDSYSFTISLTAANYCWQNLGSIEITGDLIITQGATHDIFEADYLANTTSNNTVTPPTHTTVFANDDEIAGIAYITSDFIEISNVKLIAASKTFYTSNNYTGSNELGGNNGYQDLLAGEAASYPDWASFKYIEDSVPLETNYYAKFSATVLLTYNLNASNVTNTRRLLMNSGREITQQNEMSANALVYSNPLNQVSAFGVDDMVVMMSLDQCTVYDRTWEEALARIVSKYLRIAVSRVIIELERSTNGCVAQVGIKQSTCDGVTIVELVNDLEKGLVDQFSSLHQYLYDEDTIDFEVRFNRDIFFIIQSPNTILSIGDIQEVSTETISEANETTLPWFVYTLIGMVSGGILIASFVQYKSKKSEYVPALPTINRRNSIDNRRNSMIDRRNSTATQRRVSIVDLLAKAPTEDVIDTDTVTIHSSDPDSVSSTELYYEEQPSEYEEQPSEGGLAGLRVSDD